MPRRTALASALGWSLVVACFAAAATGLALPSIAEHVLRTRVLPTVGARLGRQIDVGDVRLRLGRVVLSDVVVRGGGAPSPLSAPRVSVGFRVLPLLRGHLALLDVTLEKPRFTVVRTDDGGDNVSGILEQLRKKGGGGERGEEKAGERRGPEVVRVEGGTLTVEDDGLGVLEVGDLEAELARQGQAKATLGDIELRLVAGPVARAKKVVATVATRDGHLASAPSLTIEGGEARIWHGFAVSGVRGAITPEPQRSPTPGAPQAAAEAADLSSTRFAIDLGGGYGGVDKELFRARGWADAKARAGALSLVAARFSLGQLAPVLAGTPIVDPERAQVDARLELAYGADPEHGQTLRFDGSFHTDGLSVFHPMLGPQPVKNLAFDASVKGRFQPRSHALHVEAADVRFRGLHAHLDFDVEKLDRLRKRPPVPVAIAANTARSEGGPNGPNGHVAPILGAKDLPPPAIPAIRAQLVIDPVPCQTALAAIPAELTPNLQGFQLQGTFKSEVHLDVDPDRLEAMDLGSHIGIDGCNVVQAPAQVSAERLKGTFDHAVEVEPGSWLAFPVGPENPDWVPFADISPHLVNSIMTTEDSNFLQHKGFIGREFKSALRTNLEHGYFRLGASSITMQLVKNVLLSREKTLSRKLQELFLTWYVEHKLGKERILEIYFNVIEYGPGVYGIGRAAHHYFGKSAKDLLPREAAFFSSILPSPKRRYIHYCKGPELDLKWELYLNRILRKMHDRGRLTDEEFNQAMSSRLRFDRAEALPVEKCLEMVKRFTTPPGARGAQPAQGPVIEIPLGKSVEPFDEDAQHGEGGAAAPGPAGGSPQDEPVDPDADPVSPDDEPDDR